jgi:dihydroorotate dehydrogenase
LVKPVLFIFDPEKVHDFVTKFGQFLGDYQITRSITKYLFYYSSPSLEQTLKGIHFKNPIGLAAGFDKNALLVDILPSVGFGFEEIGSITGERCEGNSGKRLWRLRKSKGLVVYYGLKNDGAEEISLRLRSRAFQFPIGISIAKTNSPNTVETDAGILDYVKAYRKFQGIGDYYTINISCPNAYGGEPFTDRGRLESLLLALDKEKKDKPIFIKLPSDLGDDELYSIIDVSMKYNIDGFICTNLTKARTGNENIKDSYVPDKGGMSGKIVYEKSNETLRKVFKKTNGKCLIIGCGGVFSAEDAYRKIRLGASLVQLITGMVYEGPSLIGQINTGLVKLLKRDGFTNISEAVGVDA